MNLPHFIFRPAIMLSLLCISCDSDDPALIAKKNAQATEITRLKGEIALLEEKLRNLPPDVSGELERRREEVAKQQAAIDGLEAGIREQEQRKNELQREFDAYKAKYGIN
ncbi:MAG TPA: hypothetical protein VLO11_15100 [Luteolibacter sp.]|nr:hypothetical protein [Luteolibacter sp.]